MAISSRLGQRVMSVSSTLASLAAIAAFITSILFFTRTADSQADAHAVQIMNEHIKLFVERPELHACGELMGLVTASVDGKADLLRDQCTGAAEHAAFTAETILDLSGEDAAWRATVRGMVRENAWWFRSSGYKPERYDAQFTQLVTSELASANAARDELSGRVGLTLSFGEIIGVAAIVIGFSVSVMMFRVQREIHVQERGRGEPTWLAWADYLMLFALLLALVAIAILAFPHKLSSSSARWALTVCLCAVVLQAGYVPAILAHYRIEIGQGRTGPRQKGEPAERVFVLMSFILAVIVCIREVLRYQGS